MNKFHVTVYVSRKSRTQLASAVEEKQLKASYEYKILNPERV
jgi:hypothetical protein